MKELRRWINSMIKGKKNFIQIDSEKSEHIDAFFIRFNTLVNLLINTEIDIKNAFEKDEHSIY